MIEIQGPPRPPTTPTMWQHTHELLTRDLFGTFIVLLVIGQLLYFFILPWMGVTEWPQRPKGTGYDTNWHDDGWRSSSPR